jgi:hypothetical protein
MVDVFGKLRKAVMGSYLDRAVSKAVKDQGSKAVKARLAGHEMEKARKITHSNADLGKLLENMKANGQAIKKIGFSVGLCKALRGK